MITAPSTTQNTRPGARKHAQLQSYMTNEKGTRPGAKKFAQPQSHSTCGKDARPGARNTPSFNATRPVGGKIRPAPKEHAATVKWCAQLKVECPTRPVCQERNDVPSLNCRTKPSSVKSPQISKPMTCK